jgi:hypothetical protein
MIILSIMIGVPAPGEPAPGRDCEGHATLRPIVPLKLLTSAALTPDGAKAPIVGSWSSESKILNSVHSGTYYVKNVPASGATGFPDEERWRGIHYAPKGHANPVGFFFDSKKGDPFLVLEGFNPAKLKVGTDGDGSLPPKAFEFFQVKVEYFSRSFVYWNVDSI